MLNGPRRMVLRSLSPEWAPPSRMFSTIAAGSVVGMGLVERRWTGERNEFRLTEAGVEMRLRLFGQNPRS